MEKVELQQEMEKAGNREQFIVIIMLLWINMKDDGNYEIK